MRSELKTLALMLLLVGPVAANAMIVTGYFEGNVFDNPNVGGDPTHYAVGTPVRMNFTYDTDAAPVWACNAGTGYSYCDYLDEGNPYAWLVTSVTIGSDTYSFSGAPYREVLVEDALGADAFIVQQVEDNATGTKTLFGIVQDGPFVVGDYLTGTSLPTVLDLENPAGIGMGAWSDVYFSNPAERNIAFFLLTSLHLRPVIPADLLMRLSEDVNGVGPGKKLVRMVESAQTYYAVPDIQATCAVLNDFVTQVGQLSTGKRLKIEGEVALTLIADAQTIMGAIECG